MKTSFRLPIPVAARAVAFAGLLLAGCGPAIDPAAKADIDRRFADATPGTRNFQAPLDFVPRPFVVGQWTEYKLTDANGRPGFMTMKIVGTENDAFWFESTQESYTGKTATKMLLHVGDRMNPGSVDIRAVKTRDRKGNVNEVPPEVLQFMKSTYQNAVSMLAVSWQGQPQEDATVPAGVFAGCFKAQTSASWGPWHATSVSWSHSAVPISGLVKSHGIDKPTSMELVGFGDSGAASDF
jgi:hypothetical protein